jgi:hypothetical protein
MNTEWIENHTYIGGHKIAFLKQGEGSYRAVQAGDTVYIPGGGGGVGHLAVSMR